MNNKAMAFRLNILLLFSALLLFCLSTKAAAQQAAAPSPSQDYDDTEVISNVEKNKEVQDLGLFAVEEVNRKVTHSKSLAFYGVVSAKRWHGLYGWNYFLIVKSEKKEKKIKGHLLVYVYSYAYGKGVKAWIFEPTYA